jgi:undecaprenyl diphosphate synthase
MIDSYMQTAGIPDPELMIRTSGELRISNFMLWQLAYSELYFTDKLWPDFGEEDLVDAIYDYQNRERRFGKISEQLS